MIGYVVQYEVGKIYEHDIETALSCEYDRGILFYDCLIDLISDLSCDEEETRKIKFMKIEAMGRIEAKGNGFIADKIKILEEGVTAIEYARNNRKSRNMLKLPIYLDLTEEELREFKDDIDWHWVGYNHLPSGFSEGFIEEFKEKLETKKRIFYQI